MFVNMCKSCTVHLLIVSTVIHRLTIRTCQICTYYAMKLQFNNISISTALKITLKAASKSSYNHDN